MKTQSIKSIATLIAAASMLSSTVLAGPGPKGAAQEASGQTTKAVTTVAVYPSRQAVNSKSAEATTTTHAPHLIYTAHGGVTIL